MKKNIFFITALFLSVFLGANVNAEVPFGAKGAQVTQDPTLEQMLTYAIQDEYLAHEEYAVIINKYGDIRPYSNIIMSEETHINMLVPLFEKYGFKVPVNNAKEHTVVPGSLKEAAETGVQAEIDNIAMYESFLTRELPDDVRDAFIRLKEASKNHLRAFQNAVRKY